MEITRGKVFITTYYRGTHTCSGYTPSLSLVHGVGTDCWVPVSDHHYVADYLHKRMQINLLPIYKYLVDRDMRVTQVKSVELMDSNRNGVRV